MNTTTISADTSTGVAAELLRDIQQRNYGAAETKARQLWNHLGREAQAMRKAHGMLKASLDEIGRKIHQQRVVAAGQAGRDVAARLEARRLAEPEQKPSCETCVGRAADVCEAPCKGCGHFTNYEKHKEPDIFIREMRAGSMYARAVYKGTQK